MTGKERILAAFRGEQVDRVPFSPNIYQWFYYHLINRSLPAEVAGAEHPFDVLRHLGADILTRWDTQWATKAVYTAGDYSEEYTGHSDWDKPMVTAFNIYPPHTTERRRRFVTPYGPLTQVWTFTPEAGADFESKYWWTEWEEYEAIRFMLESKEYDFDAGEFHLGKQGIAALPQIDVGEPSTGARSRTAGKPAEETRQEPVHLVPELSEGMSRTNVSVHHFRPSFPVEALWTPAAAGGYSSHRSAAPKPEVVCRKTGSKGRAKLRDRIS